MPAGKHPIATFLTQIGRSPVALRKLSVLSVSSGAERSGACDVGGTGASGDDRGLSR
jgi:hypothetical protein